MAGGLFGYLLAGAAEGVGTGIVDRAKAKREQALKDLEYKRLLDRDQSQRDFTASQNELTREFTAEQNDLNRLDAAKRAEADRYTLLSAEQAEAMGLDPKKRWQVSGDNKVSEVGGGGVNIDMKGASALEVSFAKKYETISNQADAAKTMVSLYDLAEEALKTGVRTGTFGENELALRKFAGAMGIGDADTLASGELLKALQNRMALQMRNPDSGMGMPGSVSDRDILFLKDAQIGIDRSPEGNALMLEAFRRIEQRKLDIAEMADQYVIDNGNLDPKFNQKVRQYAEDNPLFADGLGMKDSTTRTPLGAGESRDLGDGISIKRGR